MDHFLVLFISTTIDLLSLIAIRVSSGNSSIFLLSILSSRIKILSAWDSRWSWWAAAKITLLSAKYSFYNYYRD